MCGCMRRLVILFAVSIPFLSFAREKVPLAVAITAPVTAPTTASGFDRVAVPSDTLQSAPYAERIHVYAMGISACSTAEGMALTVERILGSLPCDHVRLVSEAVLRVADADRVMLFLESVCTAGLPADKIRATLDGVSSAVTTDMLDALLRYMCGWYVTHADVAGVIDVGRGVVSRADGTSAVSVAPASRAAAESSVAVGVDKVVLASAAPGVPARVLADSRAAAALSDAVLVDVIGLMLADAAWVSRLGVLRRLIKDRSERGEDTSELSAIARALLRAELSTE